ncbi:cytosolic sulfotransferase 15-like [Senna tora]|uniref:Sulfotransferase n=1 Tax=Senna tora TaxID=362788 RepID=A0A834X0L7_9FABA|nr:cytosolic sulfotransferase 15-like [Senna tora]
MEETPTTETFHEEMLHSLPREKGWTDPYIYLFQHIWCRQPHIKAIISFQKHFQAKHDDIIIASLPKAGTTWLKALAFATAKRHRFIPSQNDHPLLNSNSHTLVPFFELTIYSDNNPNYVDPSTLPEPRIFGTHIPFPSLSNSIHNSNCKIIYICRNPFDTFISFWHFSNNMILSQSSQSLPTLTLEEAFERYSEGKHPFGPFWSNILGYWKASQDKPSKVLFLKYEELKADTKFELKRMAQFLDCPFTQEEESGGIIDSIIELCSFGKMKELEVNKSGKIPDRRIIENKHFFRKGEIGDWINYFSPEMTEKLSKVIEEKFDQSAWSHPEEEWLKVNVDGACKSGTTERASCGGVIRDHEGRFLLGFTKNLGYCDVISAELWGIKMGLEVAWEMGARKIVIEMDSTYAHQLVLSRVQELHPCLSLVNAIHQILARQWEVQIVHVLREANRVADFFASCATHESLDLVKFVQPPLDATHLISADANGIGTIRGLAS